MFKYNSNTFRVTAVWRNDDKIISVEFERGAVVNKRWCVSKDAEPYYHKIYSVIQKLMQDDLMEFMGIYIPPKDVPVIPTKDSQAQEKYDKFSKINPALKLLKEQLDLQIV